MCTERRASRGGSPASAGLHSRRLLWSLTRRYGIRGAAPYSFHSVARTLRGPSRYAPNWLRAESAKLYVDARGEWDWKRRSGPRWWAFLSDLLITWREVGGVHDFLRRRAQLAGLESRHPLLDDLDLIEFVLRLPPDLAYDPELSRPFARAALEGIVPDAIRLRAGKSDFSPLFVDSMSEHDHAIVAELLTGPQAETAAYARPERIHQLVNVPSERRNIALGLAGLEARDHRVLAALAIGFWLRRARARSDDGRAGRTTRRPRQLAALCVLELLVVNRSLDAGIDRAPSASGGASCSRSRRQRGAGPSPSRSP